MTARILIIAGSDSGGGAGIQGDIKTVTALGGYAATAITALTAQNTLGVFGIHEVPDAFIEQQIRLVLDDIGADYIKTGMLHKTSVIETIARTLNDYPKIPLVVDPVMVAKGGSALLQNDAVSTMIELLFTKAALITPNIPEAELLLEISGNKMQISCEKDMIKAAEILIKTGTEAVLIKGGHLEGETVIDVLYTKKEIKTYSSLRINSVHTHGTGCALASAIATFLAQSFRLMKQLEKHVIIFFKQ